MAFATAKDDKVLYVKTSIGNEITHFKCKSIEKTTDGFILQGVSGYNEDIYLINTPVLIRFSLSKGRFASIKRIG